MALQLANQPTCATATGPLLSCGSGLCRKLEHCCFRTFEHVSEEHDLPISKLQPIMMSSRVLLVDLPGNGGRVIDCIRLSSQTASSVAPHLLAKGELRSRKNTNCCPDFIRRSKPSGAVLNLWVVSLSSAPAGRDLTLCKL